ncbi:hypothetical protein EX895_004132 [Sporisorium graminicola]|uniref:Uncharacterized protein n=1 Tax=Sporisorium graminicola TaxID=280036 RepID=A0A4U7KQQ7_9BASI|nr:hypothetical protein EX895_004132 [Sporisorium graminicola]TKY86845.1 hypothetical protein EX895_004132 [Sporisorium graminicola]
MDPVTYLSQVRFHQAVLCSRTQSRVTFALGGEGWDPAVTTQYGGIGTQDPPTKVAYVHKGPILLYLLPSGCSRLLGMILEGICRHKKVSVLAIDRPGSGGTPMCSLQDRIEVATHQTLSVLEALQLDKAEQPQIDLVSHSAGWFYAMALLEAAPQYFVRHDSATRCVFSSPFVPTSLSSSWTLSLLPKSLVALSPKVLPVVSRTLGWSTGLGEDILDISKGLVSWKEADIDPSLSAEQQRFERERLEKKNHEKREASKRKNPHARFHPPYASHLKLGLDAWKQPDLRPEDRPRHPKTNRPLKTGADLLFDYVIEEGSLEGMTQDYLLCLGKAPNLDNEALSRWMLSRLQSSFKASTRLSGKAVELVVLWGGDDFMIPRKGRDYLDSVLKSSNLAQVVNYEQWEMADAGHDATLFSEVVMVDVLKFLNKEP